MAHTDISARKRADVALKESEAKAVGVRAFGMKPLSRRRMAEIAREVLDGR